MVGALSFFKKLINLSQYYNNLQKKTKFSTKRGEGMRTYARGRDDIKEVHAF